MSEPRVVAKYFGAQIEEADAHIRIVVLRQTRGLAGTLWNRGWRRQRRDGAFVKRATAETIADAQALLRAHYGGELR